MTLPMVLIKTKLICQIRVHNAGCFELKQFATYTHRQNNIIDKTS